MAWKKDLSLLLLRLCAGGLMVPHGWGKLNRLMTGLEAGEVKFYNWMGIGTEASLGLAPVQPKSINPRPLLPSGNAPL